MEILITLFIGLYFGFNIAMVVEYIIDKRFTDISRKTLVFDAVLCFFFFTLIYIWIFIAHKIKKRK